MDKIILYSVQNRLYILISIAKNHRIVFVFKIIQDPGTRNELTEKPRSNAMALGYHHLTQNCHFSFLDALFLYFALQQKQLRASYCEVFVLH